jgi:hypothetical protein
MRLISVLVTVFYANGSCLPKQSLTKKFFAGVNVFCIYGMSSFPCQSPLFFIGKAPSSHLPIPKICSISNTTATHKKKKKSKTERAEMVPRIESRMFIID